MGPYLMETSTASADAASRAAPVAVFDFDGTLTYADSLLPFVRHACGSGRFLASLVRLAPLMALTRLGWLSDQAAKERILSWTVGGKDRNELESLAISFAKGPLRRLENPEALAALEWHQQQGHRLILLSASPDLYLAPWGRARGFHDIITTQLEFHQDRATGRIAGANCKGTEKLRRMRSLISDWDSRESWAYGDSPSDRILLETVRHPFYKPFRSRPGWHRQSLAAWFRSLTT